MAKKAVGEISMGKKRGHAAALWLCVDNSSLGSNETPLAAHALSKDKCQEPGMRRRVRHLRTCQSEAPIALATSTIADQRAGEKTSIPHDRDSLSPLSRTTIPLKGQTVSACYGMADKDPLIVTICRRMRRFRLAAGLTQKEMGKIVGLSEDTYKKQETRSGIQRYNAELFAQYHRITVDQLLSSDPEPEMIQKRAPAKKRRKLPKAPEQVAS